MSQLIEDRTDRVQDVQPVQQICGKCFNVVQAFFDSSYPTQRSVNFLCLIHRTAPISANLTPRSAPLSPLPMKGSITPGES